MNVSLRGQLVGDGEPCFIVAEAGENANGNVDMACAQIKQAALAGADAVKFQTIAAEELYNPSSPSFAERKRMELSLSHYTRLVETARANGLIMFSTPFDEDSADFLDELGVPCFKMGSGELSHYRLLHHVAKKGKPMIVSTGAAEQEWIDAAVQVIKKSGNNQIILTHCVSMYPAPVELANIRAIPTLREHLAVLVGLSDHTMSTVVPMAAVALGACLVEKHFTLSRALPGGDNAMSLEPAEFKAMVQGIREVERALGTGQRSLLPEEEPLIRIARRGIYARIPILKGQRIEPSMLAVRRPLSEIAADQFDRVVGRIAQLDLAAEEPLRWKYLQRDQAIKVVKKKEGP